MKFLRKLAIRLIVVLVACAISLGLVELVLRGTPSPLANAARARNLYVLDEDDVPHARPGWSRTYVVDGRECLVEIDDHGRRKPSPPRADGQKAVLVLGDSVPFGHGVAGDEAVPPQIQKALGDARGVDAVAWNAALPGTAPFAHAAELRRQRRIDEPDLVVSCIYIGNDFLDQIPKPRIVVDGYYIDGPIASIAKSSWRVRLALQSRLAYQVEAKVGEFFPSMSLWVEANRAPKAAETIMLEQSPVNTDIGFFADATPATPFVDALLARFRSSYVALQAEAAKGPQGGPPIVVVIFPTAWHCIEGLREPELKSRKLDLAAHPNGGAQKHLVALLEDLGLPVLDLTGTLTELEDRASAWLPKDRHLSVAGCQVAGKAIAEFIAPRLGD